MAKRLTTEEIVNLSFVVRDNLDHLTATEWPSKSTLAKWVKELVPISSASDEAIYTNVKQTVQQLGGVLRLKGIATAPYARLSKKVDELALRVQRLEELARNVNQK